MKNKKGSAELIAIIIIVVIGATIALVVAQKNANNINQTNNVVQSQLSQISL